VTFITKPFRNQNDIYLFLKNYFSQELEIPEHRIFPETKLYEDLSLDSIDAFNLAGMIEKEVDIEIADGDLKKILTVQDIIDYIAQCIHLDSPSSSSATGQSQ